jgi:colicin import membrane protein
MVIFSDYNKEGFKWRPMLVLSLLLHVALFSALFWVPGTISGGLKMNEVVYEVNLVDASKSNLSSVDPSAPAPKKTQTRAASADNRQARRISDPARQKDAVTVSKRTVKRSTAKPKKEQASSSQLLDRAISKIEKKVKTENNADYLNKTIAALDKKVGSSGPGSGRGGSAGSMALNMYRMEVETWIKSNWTYPDVQEIEATVLVKIRKDGTVLETRFIKPSGNKLFDESVLKAIEKASPLPPLPEGYEENYEEIKINFNLKDLE